MEHVLSRDVADVAYRLCESLATPRALTVAILLRYGEWDQLASLRADPGRYLTASDYYRDVVATDFLRKLEELPTSFDRAGKARENFWLAERECYATNERLSPFLYGGKPEDSVVSRVISKARKKIGDVLGKVPDLLDGRFGPGATYSDKGQLSTVPDKMSSRPTLTPGAIGWLFQWSSTAWASACAARSKDPLFVAGNRFTTVPKDCTKDRGIAVEPSINVFYQLSLGKAIRGRLRRVGIDLTHGQDIHRRAACESSIRGHLATIDLSNASDTVSRNLVKLLLPHVWYDALDSLRSPTTLIDGKRVRLEKFSSMGNGYTFELETLIFFGICWAVLDELGYSPIPGEDLLVYGDDIIVPSQFSGEIIAALRFFGFSVNVNKTFVGGPFRESCGGDYFLGTAVRPFYLKKEPHEPSEWIALANGLFRLGRPDSSGRLHDLFPLRARNRVLDLIPNDVRSCRGPQALGDLVITDEDGKGITRWRHGIRYWRVYRPAKYRRIPWAHFGPEVILASALYGTGDGRLGVTPRNAVTGYRLGWVAYS